MVVILLNFDDAENIASNYVFLCWEHRLIDAFIDDEILVLFCFEEVSQINKLSGPEQSIEREMFFSIDGAIL